MTRRILSAPRLNEGWIPAFGDPCIDESTTHDRARIPLTLTLSLGGERGSDLFSDPHGRDFAKVSLRGNDEGLRKGSDGRGSRAGGCFALAAGGLLPFGADFGGERGQVAVVGEALFQVAHALRRGRLEHHVAVGALHLVP